MSDHRTAPCRLPPHEVYWAVIDTTGLPPIPFAPLRRGAARRRLEHLLDPLLPVPVETTHSAFRQVSPDRVIACAAEQSRLTDLRAQGHLGVTPAALPHAVSALIGEAGLDPGELNLLTGAFEPFSLQRARARRFTTASLALVLSFLLLGFGNIRRESTYSEISAQLREQQQALYISALGSLDGPLPPAVRLTSELRRLRVTRDPALPISRDDAAIAMEGLLASWPRQAELRVDRLAITTDRIDLSAEAAGADTAESLIARLRDTPSWRITQNRVDRVGGSDAVRLRLALERTATAQRDSR